MQVLNAKIRYRKIQLLLTQNLLLNNDRYCNSCEVNHVLYAIMLNIVSYWWKIDLSRFHTKTLKVEAQVTYLHKSINKKLCAVECVRRTLAAPVFGDLFGKWVNFYRLLCSSYISSEMRPVRTAELIFTIYRPNNVFSIKKFLWGFNFTKLYSSDVNLQLNRYTQITLNGDKADEKFQQTTCEKQVSGNRTLKFLPFWRTILRSETLFCN